MPLDPEIREGARRLLRQGLKESLWADAPDKTEAEIDEITDEITAWAEQRGEEMRIAHQLRQAEESAERWPRRALRSIYRSVAAGR